MIKIMKKKKVSKVVKNVMKYLRGVRKENSKCKGSEAAPGVACLGRSKKACVLELSESQQSGSNWN